MAWRNSAKNRINATKLVKFDELQLLKWRRKVNGLLVSLTQEVMFQFLQRAGDKHKFVSC